MSIPANLECQIPWKFGGSPEETSLQQNLLDNNNVSIPAILSEYLIYECLFNRSAHFAYSLRPLILFLLSPSSK